MKKSPQKYKYNHVLLIDDNELDNFINEKIIEGNCYAKKVYVSTNGKSALEFIKNLIISGAGNNDTYPDVLFIDLNMPIMDGFEFIEHFKKISDQKLMECKLVILTSSISNLDRIRAEKIGNGLVFVNKPLTNEVLDALP